MKIETDENVEKKIGDSKVSVINWSTRFFTKTTFLRQADYLME